MSGRARSGGAHSFVPMSANEPFGHFRPSIGALFRPYLMRGVEGGALRTAHRRFFRPRPEASESRRRKFLDAIFKKAKSSFCPPSSPLVLLLLALSTVFLFGNDRGRFYRDGHHDWLSSQNLTLAVNLSPDHDFLLFVYRTLGADGSPSYATYARFPIGGYALIKLATLPFGNDLSARIHAARTMFLLFFSASAVLTYLFLCRLTADHWIALAATALAFSSYYLLYYSDMIATDNGLSLFGVLLTLHGMAVFVQEGRLRQLLIKACTALLLGWHVYALLLPFIVLGLLTKLNRAFRLSAPAHLTRRIKACVAALLFSGQLRLGVVTLLFGMAVLSFNVGNEYRALGGEVALTELPTMKSAAKRFGANPEFNERFGKVVEWRSFLENQFHHIARATLPFHVSPFDNYAVNEGSHDSPEWHKDHVGVLVGALAACLSAIGVLVSREKILLASLVLFGLCWALLMRHHTAIHDFESVFYIGIPLTIYSMTLLYLRKLFGGKSVTLLAGAALLLFVLSNAEMAGVGEDSHQALTEVEMMQDFEVIRSIVDEGVVYVPTRKSDPEFGGAAKASSYFLAGSFIEFGAPSLAVHRSKEGSLADYLVMRRRIDVPALLTPENRRIFLYRQSDYLAQIERMISESEFVFGRNGYFDVYRAGKRLIYVGNRGEDGASSDVQPSGATDTALFFLHVIPVEFDDLPDGRERDGFDNLDFRFDDYEIPLADRPVAVRTLPDYPIARVRTGQYTDDGRLWEGEIRFNEQQTGRHLSAQAR